MTKQEAIDAAKAEKSDLVLAIVNAPIENAEDVEYGRGPYGYCPVEAVPILFPYGNVEATVEPR